MHTHRSSLPSRHARLTRGPWRKAAWGVAMVAVVVPLLASWAFEPLLRWGANRWLAPTGYQLQLGQAHWNPWRLAWRVQGLSLLPPQGPALLQLDAVNVDLAWASLWRRTWVLEDVQLQAPSVSLALRADGGSNWGDFLAALPPSDAPADPHAPPPRLLLQALKLEQGQLRLHDERWAAGATTQLQDFSVQAQGLSTLPLAEPGDLNWSLRSGDGAQAQGQGRLGLAPFSVEGELGLQGLALSPLWPYARQHLGLAPWQGELSLSLAYRVAMPDGVLQAQLERTQLELKHLALLTPAASSERQAAGQGLTLQQLQLQGGSVDLGTRQIQIERISLSGPRLNLTRRPDGQLDWLNALSPATPVASVTPTTATTPTPAPSGTVTALAAGVHPSSAPGPWQVKLAALQIKGGSLSLNDLAQASPLSVALDDLGLQLRAQAQWGADAPQVQVHGLALQGRGLRLSQQDQAWFSLAGVNLSGGELSLAERQWSLEQVALDGAQLRAQRGAQGGWQTLLMGAPTGEPALAPAAIPAKPAAPAASVASGDAGRVGAPWRWRVGAVTLGRSGLVATDASVQPPARLEVLDLTAQVGPLTPQGDQAIPVSLGFRLASGGRLAVTGQVTPGPNTPAVDVRLQLDELALAPAAPYLARQTALQLADGRFSSQGRVQWANGRWGFSGGAALHQLRLNERNEAEPLLAWKTLSVPTVVASPDGAQVGEVALDGLRGRLTIFKDRSVNLVQALSPPAAPAVAVAPTPASAASSAAAAVDGAAPSAAPAYPVSVERVRLSGGEVAFADLSLALPFAAHIRELGGQVVGLSTQPGTVAQVELGGRVETYGEAQVSGSVSPAQPTEGLDLRVLFRNVEMTTLTPYSATFAGRRIDSGKLSLDLRYRIEGRQLQGDNQVIMDQLTLGERVESASALDLPLDLALAILKDSRGRIELGLPVSGSLDDPQFSVGQIVWKAVGNVLSKLVTAPFRALAALLGGGGEALPDRIAFVPGQAVLAPPQREKLLQVSQLLAQRPGLALGVQPAFDPEADLAALRDLALRRDVALQGGRTLAPHQDPGPIAATEPATRAALQALWVQRLGAPALAELQQAVVALDTPASSTASGSVAGAGAAASSTSTGLSPAAQARLAGLMLARLRQTQPLPSQPLESLAAQREQVVRAELERLGVDAQRVRALAVVQHAATDEGVNAVLSLEANAAPTQPASR